jgi:protein O-mannosyl-transferase
LGDEQLQALLGGLLLALTVTVYWQVSGFGFLVFDDPAYVSENRQVLAGLNGAGLRWAWTGFHDANWIPLTWLSLMADATFYGARAGGYHLTNLLLHCANVLLVLALFSRLTGDVRRSAFVAGLFAVHPLHVESVAWIAERKDVLSLFFGLLSLNAYVAYAQRGRYTALFLSWLWFVCSLLSKQTLVTLPFVFLLLDWFPLARTRFERGRNLLLEKIPFCIASGVFCVIVFAAQAEGHAIRSFVPLASRCLNAIFVYGHYIWKTLVPFNLAAYYPHPGRDLSLLAVAASFATLLVLTIFAVASAKRRPFVLVGWLWFLGALVPLIGLVQIGGQQMADRYLYFPSLGLYAALAWLVPSSASLGPLRSRVFSLAAGGIVAACACLAFFQTGYWRDSVTLFRHSLAVTPDNAFARSALGSALLERGEYDEAIVHLQQAVELDPRDAQVHFLLGSGLQGVLSLDEAVAEYRTSLAINAHNGAAHNNLGLILFRERCYAEARGELLQALAEDENDIRAWVNLALLSDEVHDFAATMKYGQRALELEPNQEVCRCLLANALRAQGRYDEAQGMSDGYQ